MIEECRNAIDEGLSKIKGSVIGGNLWLSLLIFFVLIDLFNLALHKHISGQIN